MTARLRVLLAGVSLPLALWLALPLLSHADLSDRASDLRSRIDRKQRQIERQRGREGRLESQIVRYSRSIGRLQDRLGGLTTRENALQTDLDAKLARLASIQENLRTERALLVRLRTRLTSSRRVLANRLVELYKADPPDLVTVILQSDGFADLMERTDFLSRVGHQDKRIITRVVADKEATTRTTKRLAGLEATQRELTAQVLSRRNAVAAVRRQVSSQRDTYAEVRSNRNGVLRSVRSSRKEAQDDVAALQRESSRVQAKLSGLTGGTAAPIRRGSGALIWPVNGPITSPFCERRSWESCHPGIDIGVGSGTPIRAAASGRVSLAGPQGGYGNYTCIQHSGSLSTCYAHQSSIGVSVGQQVRQGQVIGRVGCTGLCFGAHLHFEVRVNGAVTDPLSYL
jgi:murein DD-endopeptidase MepM/ murein hydrolase activator NlpD